MQYLLIPLLFSSLFLCAEEVSTLKIPPKECMKAKYAHTLGGTIHSQKLLKKRLLQKIESSLPHSNKEALKLLQQKYPHLHINRIDLILRNCKGYYYSNNSGKPYYFDPLTLTIIKRTGAHK